MGPADASQRPLACVVSPDWARHSGITPLAQQVVQPSDDLRRELALLSRLLYKNFHQHHRTDYFKKLQGIARWMRLLFRVDSEAALESLAQALLSSTSHSTLPRDSMDLAYGYEVRRIPSQAWALQVGCSVLSSAQLLARLVPAALHAGKSLTQQLSLGLFAPLCLTLLAVVARVRTLAAARLMSGMRAYRAVMEAAALLPRGARAESPEGGRAGEEAALPRAIQCSWDAAGVPTLAPENYASASGASLTARSEQAEEKFLLRAVDRVCSRSDMPSLTTATDSAAPPSPSILPIVDDLAEGGSDGDARPSAPESAARWGKFAKAMDGEQGSVAARSSSDDEAGCQGLKPRATPSEPLPSFSLSMSRHRPIGFKNLLATQNAAPSKRAATLAFPSCDEDATVPAPQASAPPPASVGLPAAEALPRSPAYVSVSRRPPAAALAAAAEAVSADAAPAPNAAPKISLDQPRINLAGAKKNQKRRSPPPAPAPTPKRSWKDWC